MNRIPYSVWSLLDGPVAPQLKLPHWAEPQVALPLPPLTGLPKGSNTPSQTIFIDPSVIFCGVPSWSVWIKYSTGDEPVSSTTATGMSSSQIYSF